MYPLFFNNTNKEKVSCSNGQTDRRTQRTYLHASVVFVASVRCCLCQSIN